MQDPSPESGTFFRREWFRRYDTRPETLNFYICHDLAVSENAGDFSEVAVLGVDPDDKVFVVDWWSGQTTLDVTIEALLDLAKRYKPRTIFGESGIIRRAIEPFLTKRMKERGDYFTCEWLNRSVDKSACARAFQGMASMGLVHLPNIDWADEVLDQLMRFPAGRYDDKVDALALLGMAMDQVKKPAIARPAYRRFRKKRTAWAR